MKLSSSYPNFTTRKYIRIKIQVISIRKSIRIKIDHNLEKLRNFGLSMAAWATRHRVHTYTHAHTTYYFLTTTTTHRSSMIQINNINHVSAYGSMHRD